MFHLGLEEHGIPPGSSDEETCETRHQRDTEARIVVDVTRVVPVADGAAHVLRIIPEGAAPQDAGL